jgi:hypothetical protein
MKRHPDDGWVLADPYPMRLSTRRALRGLIRALCPPPPGPQLPDLEERLELHVRRMLMYMVPVVALGFVLSVHLLDWSPIWRLRGASRIQRLPREDAEHAIAALVVSPSTVARTLILGVRALVLSTFYDQDEAHRAMGYEPVPFLTERVALRGRLLASVTHVARQPDGPS